MIKNSRVILVHPNTLGNYVQGTIARENLGLSYLSAYLKMEGHSVDIIDARITGQTPTQAADSILNLNPSLVGFSLISKDAAKWTEEVSKILQRERRKNPVHITLGNFYPTLQPQDALLSIPSADSVVTGEGEITLSYLSHTCYGGKEWHNLNGLAYRRKDGTVQINSHQRLIADLDTLPIPIHYAPDYGLKEFAIEGSRGCYCRCSFCAISPHISADSTQNRWRARSPRSIVDEIKKLHILYPNIDLFRFVDPDFIGAPRHLKRLEEFISLLQLSNLNIRFIIDTRTKVINNIPRDIWYSLKSVGLEEVYLGIENATPLVKKMMRKGTLIDEDKQALDVLGEAGINARFGYMMITPWTTEADIEVNARILRGLGFARLDKYFQEMNLVIGTDAIELTQKTSKVWNDGDSGYLTYELPFVVDNLRNISRILAKEHVNFLNRFLVMHKIIERINVNEIKTVYKEALNDINLEFFLLVFNAIKPMKQKLEPEVVRNIAQNIIIAFIPKLSKLESRLSSLSLK